MRRILKQFFWLFFLVPSLYAQTTSISAAAVDSDGTTWANGSWKIAFTPNPTKPNPASYNIGGVPLDPAVMSQSGFLDGSGVLAVSIYQQAPITPIGSSWTLTVCPNAVTACGVYNFIAVGSSMNLSSALTAVIPAPRFIPVAGTYGYADVEAAIQTKASSTYWNVTSSCQKYYDGSSWSCGSLPSGCFTGGVTPITCGGTGATMAAVALANLTAAGWQIAPLNQNGAPTISCSITNGGEFYMSHDSLLYQCTNATGSYVWTSAINGAQAALGYTPVNKAGDTMTGQLNGTGAYFSGSIQARAALEGAALYATTLGTSGDCVQISSITVGLLTSSGAPCNTGSTTNALTISNSGAGAVSGTTFNGAATVTISANTVGAVSSTLTTPQSMAGELDGTIINGATSVSVGYPFPTSVMDSTGISTSGALTGTSASFSGNVVAASETLGSPLLPASGGTGATTAAGANLNITGVTQTGTLGTSSQVSTFSGTVAAQSAVVGGAIITGTNATGICQAASARGFLLNGTDETATLLTQLTAAQTAQKGYCLTIDAGKSLTIASVFTIPNDGASVPHQIPIRITGATATTNSHGDGVTTTTTSILNLANTGTAKIVSLGSGVLEIDHVSLVDSSTNCVPFLLSTNTTINIHDNLFYGEHLNSSACNDGIIIGGGTSTVYGGLVTSPNQGYVDQIWNNTFVGMRTLVHLNQFANAVNVYGNYNYNCGTAVSGTADGASAYELPNDTAYNVQGGTFTANHVEVTNYRYAFRCGYGCGGVTFQGNDTWDPTPDTLGAYYLQNSLNISVSSALDNAGSNGAWSEVGPWVGKNTYNLAAVHTGTGDQLYASGGTPGIALQNTQAGTPLWKILTGWTNQYTIDFQYTTGGISPFVLTNAGVGTFLSYINATGANAFSGAVIAKGAFPGFSWISNQTSANPFTVNTGYTALNTWSVYYNGGTDLFDLVGGTLAAKFYGVVQAAGYKSSDGSAGYTGATGVSGCTVKNGLIVSCP